MLRCPRPEHAASGEDEANQQHEDERLHRQFVAVSAHQPEHQRHGDHHVEVQKPRGHQNRQRHGQPVRRHPGKEDEPETDGGAHHNHPQQEHGRWREVARKTYQPDKPHRQRQAIEDHAGARNVGRCAAMIVPQADERGERPGNFIGIGLR